MLTLSQTKQKCLFRYLHVYGIVRIFCYKNGGIGCRQLGKNRSGGSPISLRTHFGVRKQVGRRPNFIANTLWR